MKPLVNNEAFGKALDFLQGDHQIRSAERDQPRRRRHPQPVHLRPLRAVARLGRHRHARHRPGDVEGHRQGRRRHPARLQAGARPRHRQARRLHRRHLPLRHRRRQPRPVRGVRRLVAAASTPQADQKVKDAAYAFFSYMAQPAQSNVDVTIGKTGFNPYRISPVQEPGQLDQGRHERGGGEELSRRHRGQPQLART